MTRPRTRKLVRDLWLARGRVGLMVVAIAVALTGVGALLVARAVILREANAAYAATNPASATLDVAGGVDAALLARCAPGPVSRTPSPVRPSPPGYGSTASGAGCCCSSSHPTTRSPRAGSVSRRAPGRPRTTGCSSNARPARSSTPPTAIRWRSPARPGPPPPCASPAPCTTRRSPRPPRSAPGTGT
ncbi:hypothetical protein ACFQX7_13180 [Luedemannella flava]